MSTTSPKTSGPNKFLRRLITLLACDRVNRLPPPPTLPGRPAPTIPPKLEPPPTPTTRSPAPQFNYIDTRRLCQEEAEPCDIFGTWPRTKILKMDACFVRRVERAFRRGTETREAAGASYASDRLKTCSVKLKAVHPDQRQ